MPTALLSQYLPAAHVIAPLTATTFRDAVTEMVSALVAAGDVQDPALLEQAMINARGRDVVAIGPDVVLPHFRTDGVDRLVVALGVASEPLEVGDADLDTKPRVIALVIAPPEAATLYLQTVAALASFFQGRDVVRRLTDATSAAEVLAMPELNALRIRPQLRVGDLMTHGATTVAPDMKARDAVDIMVRKKLRALTVVGENGEVLGIITEWDVMRALLPHIPRVADSATTEDDDDPGLEQPSVREVMTRSVLCISQDMGLEEAVNLMINKKVEQCPVVFESQFVGMLTRSDIIRKLFAR